MLLYFWFRDLNEEIPIYLGSCFQAGKVIIFHSKHLNYEKSISSTIILKAMDQMIRNPHLTPSLQIQQSGQAESFVFWKRRMFQLVRRRRRRMGWDGNRQAVQNMLDAIFGVQLSGHLRFSHEWRCVRCYSEDHYTQLLWSRASFHQTVDCRAQHSPLPTDLNLAASLCRFSKRDIVALMSAGWQVSNQDWKCRSAKYGRVWGSSSSDHFPRTCEPVGLIRSRPSGPFTGQPPDWGGLLMDPFLHFMDARSMILIKIIGSYRLLYTAQTVPTHPESFNIDCFENGNQTYVKVNQNQRLLLFLCRNTAAVVL